MLYFFFNNALFLYKSFEMKRFSVYFSLFPKAALFTWKPVTKWANFPLHEAGGSFDSLVVSLSCVACAYL